MQLLMIITVNSCIDLTSLNLSCCRIDHMLGQRSKGRCVGALLGAETEFSFRMGIF